MEEHDRKIKVLFLDVDGVLNCKSRWKGPYAEHLDPECLSYLVDIVDKTGCKIVVSSSWRFLGNDCGKLLPRLKQEGLSIIDKTPEINCLARGEEIALWIEEHENQIEAFAILDDDTNAGSGYKAEFFKTEFDTGLTRDIANNIITHLAGNET